MRRLLLIFSILFFNLYPTGFVKETLVRTFDGYKPIGEIYEGDYVTCSNDHGFVFSMPVLFVTKHHVNQLVEITFGEGEKLYLSPNQVINTGHWVMAGDLIPGLNPRNLKNPDLKISKKRLVDVDTEVYDLSINTYSNFYVTTQDVLVHNFVPLVAPAVPVVGAGAMKVAGVIAGCGLSYVVKDALQSLRSSSRKRKSWHRKSEEGSSSGSASCGGGEPPDPPWKDSRFNRGKRTPDSQQNHPNGMYKDAPYHNKNGTILGKSPCPKDGQAALDNSVQIKDTSVNRIGISKGEFVVLNYTCPGEYHGHVRTWSELNGRMRAALQKNGMTTSSGRIK